MGGDRRELKGGPSGEQLRRVGVHVGLLAAGLASSQEKASVQAMTSVGVEGRPVLEVWSSGGAILEGVFEVSERAEADLFVAMLAAGGGVRAKVLELDVKGIASRPAQVKAAWDSTAYPPCWSVVALEGSRVAIKVYDNWTDAETWASHLTRTTGQPHRFFYWRHPHKPEVGGTYDENAAPVRVWAKVEATEPQT